MTTKAEFDAWVERGRANGRSYLIVIADTFEYANYPSFADTADEVSIIRKNCMNDEFSRVMEVVEL